jgi:hypothetical protein
MNIYRYAFSIGDNADYSETENSAWINNFDLPIDNNSNTLPDDTTPFYIPESFSIQPEKSFTFTIKFEPFKGLIKQYGYFFGELVITSRKNGIDSIPISINLTARAFTDSVVTIDGVEKEDILSFFSIGKQNITSIK